MDVSELEQKIIISYRQNPDMQRTIRKLLDIPDPSGKIISLKEAAEAKKNANRQKG